MILRPKCARPRSHDGLLLPLCTGILGSVAVALYCLLNVGHSIVVPAYAQAGSTVIESLERGRPIRQELTSPQTLLYSIATKADSFFSLTVTASGIGVRATLLDQSGKVLSQTACSYDRTTQLASLTGEPTNYQLRIESCESEPITGTCVVDLTDERPKNNNDRDRVAATQALIEGSNLLAEPGTTRQAVEKYQTALQLWQRVGDLQWIAETLGRLGEVTQTLGNRRAALQYLNEGLKNARRVKNSRAESELLGNIGFLEAMMGDNQGAVVTCARALSISRLNNDLQAEAQAYSSMGEAYNEMGERAQALECQASALRIGRQIKNRKIQAWALLRGGYATLGVGEVQDALLHYREALPLFRAVADYQGQGLTLAAMGHLDSQTGDKQGALGFYHQALELSDKIDVPALRAELCAGMGFVYFELGEANKAISSEEEALALYSAMPDRWGVAGTHLTLGRLYNSMGDRKRALEEYGLAAVNIWGLHSLQLEIYLLRLTADVYEQEDQIQLALSNYEQALAISRSGKNPRNEAIILNRIGEVYEKLGQHSKALGYFNRSLPITHAVGDCFSESLTLVNLARVHRNLQELVPAKDQIERAIGLFEQLRSNVFSRDLRTSYFALVRQNYELYVDILMQLNRGQPSQGFASQAFEMSDHARARALLETLNEAHTDIRQGVDATLLERERLLEQELNAKGERHTQLVVSGKKEEAETVASETDRLTSEYAEIRGQIRAQSPHYAALMQPHPLSLRELQQQLLDEDTVLVEYMLGDERSYVWAVTKAGIASHELPGRVEIEKAADRYYELVTAKQPRQKETPQETQARAEQAAKDMPGVTASLSKLLLAPVLSELGTKRLLIVPDGVLQYIPFQILTVPALSGGSDSVALNKSGEERPLVLDHEIIYEPSASTLALLIRESANRKTANGSVAVMADPVFDAEDSRIKSPKSGSSQAAGSASPNEVTRALRDVGVNSGAAPPRLGSSREEANAIMAVVPWRTGFEALDFQANRATVLGLDLGQYRVVHFATHALLNNEHPALSGIVLSLVDQKGQRQDGYLRLQDIYNLKLPVDLVVLSACQTGLGKDVKGEGLIGLTRGFMYAGASGVVASLWKVDDEATAELMKYFYQGMFERGLSPAAALREAQLAMRQQKRWHEPYYWAGFVIQGQYNGRGNMKQPWTVPRLVMWGTFGALLVLAILVVLKRKRRRLA